MRRNADVLVDSHGIGGDPGQGEVYGYASWSTRKGILVLRNPTDRPARFRTDLRTAFELPDGASQRYRLASPWRGSVPAPAVVLRADQKHAFDLAPFEVLVLEGEPLPE
jgi:hypothetical protein